MADEIAGLLREVLASPLGDVIASVGEGVAAAQQALDEAAVAKTLDIYREGGDEMVAMLRGIGYRPTFYVLPETTGEVAVSLRLSGSGTRSPSPGTPALAAARAIASAARPRARMYATPVDAAFANRYAFAATASARLTFRIVPVPPPEGMDRVRVMPDLSGRKLGDALRVLDLLDLAPRILDAQGATASDPPATATIAATEPAGGAVVSVAEDIVVRLG